MSHRAYIGWVQVSGAWALCVLHSHVSLWFVCRSCIFHCLWICLVSLRIFTTYFLTLCGVGESGSCLGTGPFFFNSTPVSFYFWFVGWLVFLSCHSIAFVMLLLDLCLLGLLWACHVLFLYLVHVDQYFCLVNSYNILGFLGPFYSFGYPRPTSFF